MVSIELELINRNFIIKKNNKNMPGMTNIYSMTTTRINMSVH